jgi:serine/threonine-protein phosphatase PGAM5
MKRLPLLLLLTLTAPAAGAAPTPQAPSGVHYLYLVRHGAYDPVDSLDDRVANGLNALGHQQARLIGGRLARLPVRMASLVTSDLTRARQTAADIGEVLAMEPKQDSLLRECTPVSERADYMRNHSPGDIAACESQLKAAWAKYARPSPDADSRDVLVCHGNVIRWFVTRALGADSRLWSSMDIANGSLTVIAVRSDSTTRLVTFSDVGHLPVDWQTWTGRGAGWVRAPEPGAAPMR